MRGRLATRSRLSSIKIIALTSQEDMPINSKPFRGSKPPSSPLRFTDDSLFFLARGFLRAGSGVFLRKGREGSVKDEAETDDHRQACCESWRGDRCLFCSVTFFQLLNVLCTAPNTARKDFPRVPYSWR